MKKVSTAVMVTIALSGCASMTNTERTLSEMALAGLIGGTIGSIKTPEGDDPAIHAALWGSVAAAVAGAGGAIFNSSDREIVEQRKQIVALQKELNVYGENESPTNTGESRSMLESDLPEEYRSLVQPGKWQIYKMNQWVSDGENVLVHKDKMIRVTPPQLRVKTTQTE